jgi:membrane protease YdiL (CAAX protease family)
MRAAGFPATAPAPLPQTLRRLGLTAGVLAATVVAALAIAFANQPYFDLVNGIIGATDPLARSVIFSSWLVLVAGGFVVWRPATFGFQLGDVRREWLVIVTVCAAAGIVTAALLRLTGATPYSDASLLVESGLVPFTEELAFRGVLLGLLLLTLGRLHRARRAATLAVVFNGVAFGLAHVANATTLDLSFVLSQVTFAIFLGLACAYLAVRTRSVLPAMLLHAVVNAVVVLI